MEWKYDGRPIDPNSTSFNNMKVAKKRLRSTQTQHEAVLRKANYEKIMKAHEGDQQIFYRLIANQRRDGTVQTTCLKVDDILLTTPDGIRNGWTNYFQELATPNYIENGYHNQVKLDCLFIEEIKNRNLETGLQTGWCMVTYSLQNFYQPLFALLQRNQLGCYIGSIYCGTPTVADDICLASNCPYELQIMLDLRENYARQENYTISETKSTVLHLSAVRQPFMDALDIVMEETLSDSIRQLILEPNQLTQIILDCSSSPFVLPQYYNRLECIGKGLCYALRIDNT
ncbi:unnamed protein product [Mytilus coruscus]|uniref:Reverse transcriptase domain-containing protein n=1 Tax=Mytilus coruscus TaxID=42192 RepID=A0A6J8DV80_MYTCO|nr:unnamed protein product [Mytilus coruscus]